MKTIRLILTFYKSFAFTSLITTFICLGLLYGFREKGIYVLQALFWFKMITLAVIVYMTDTYKRKEFYYYKNLGVSKLTLWLPILIFEFLLFVITTITLASKLYETLPGS